MKNGGKKAIKVYGTTDKTVTDTTTYDDKQIYKFNVVYIMGDLELSTELRKQAEK